VAAPRWRSLTGGGGQLRGERGDDAVELSGYFGGVGLVEDGAHQRRDPGLVLFTLVSRSRR
jgi:hypothetical protein